MNNEEITIKIVNGYDGKSIYINDYRVAGSKPWGCGTIEKTWVAKKKDILIALGIKNDEDLNK